MFLIPYLYKKKEALYTIHSFYIFLQNGNLFLQMEENEIDDFLEDNGFFYKNKTIQQDYCFIAIDSEKTNINSFYSYIENSDAECWRRFLIVGSLKEDVLHINATNPDFIQPILKILEQQVKEQQEL